MSSKDITKEAKKPDAIRVALTQLFEKAVANAKPIFGGLVVVVLAGGGWALTQHFEDRKEARLQERYSAIEKELVEKRQKFDEAEQQARLAASQPADAKKKDITPPAGQPSGDLAKDYGDIPSRLEALIAEAPKSNAAEMAALSLAELLVRHKEAARALEVIGRVNAGSRTSDLTGALVVNLRAALMADQGQCGAALPLWERLTKDPKAGFLHGEAKLRMGLCYESTNDLARAEETYQSLASQAAEDKNDSAVNESIQRDAEKYLRLLRMKKARGS